MQSAQRADCLTCLFRCVIFLSMDAFLDMRHLVAAGAARPIADLIEPVAVSAGFRIIRVVLGGGGGRRLQVMAERTDGSMDLEGCASLSRNLSAFLDEKDPIEGSYALEVSSPGVRRPLSSLEDFQRWSGHEARIELASPPSENAARKRFSGILEGVEGVEKQCIAIRTEDGLVSIPAQNIARACLLESGAAPRPEGGDLPASKPGEKT